MHCIQHLECDLEDNDVKQGETERSKYRSSLQETEEIALRVSWFDEGDAQKNIMDLGRLLCCLPLSSRCRSYPSEVQAMWCTPVPGLDPWLHRFLAMSGGSHQI